MNNLKEKYEQFHKNARKQVKVVYYDNFTYKPVLTIIDKYLNKDMKVLDIGCATGTISLYMANKGNEVTGLDISQKAINAAQESAEILGFKKVKFFPENFLQSHIQEKFDFIVINHVIEHLIDDQKALQKINQLSHEKAILFIFVPAKKALIHNWRMKLFKKDIFDEEVGHLRRYNINDLATILKNNGFRILEINYQGGTIREFMYCFKFGNQFIRFASLPIIKHIVTFFDNITAKLFAYELYAVTRKDQ